MQKIRKAIIPAAGFGTRFLPETKAMPKEMLPIVDKPTIQYIPAESTGYEWKKPPAVLRLWGGM
jgi:UTP-glucose-1-phosphate uridylyltransferase